MNINPANRKAHAENGGCSTYAHGVQVAAVFLCAVTTLLLALPLAAADETPPATKPPETKPEPVGAFLQLDQELNRIVQEMSALREEIRPAAAGSVEGILPDRAKALSESVFQRLNTLLGQLTKAQDALKQARDQFPMRPVAKLIPVENASPTKVAQLLAVFNVAGAKVVPNDEMKIIAVSGPADAVSEVEQAVKLLDKPGPPEVAARNVELLVYILRGGAAPTPASAQDALSSSLGGGGLGVPDNLKGVTDELRRTFPYAAYTLIDTLLLRCRSGEEAETSNSLSVKMPGADEAVPITQKLNLGKVTVDKESSNLVRIDDFVYGAIVPIMQPTSPAGAGRSVLRAQERREFGLKADLDVRVGQVVVVGKANFGEPDSALFVVVTARVIDAP